MHNNDNHDSLIMFLFSFRFYKANALAGPDPGTRRGKSGKYNFSCVRKHVFLQGGYMGVCTFPAFPQGECMGECMFWVGTAMEKYKPTPEPRAIRIGPPGFPPGDPPGGSQVWDDFPPWGNACESPGGRQVKVSKHELPHGGKPGVQTSTAPSPGTQDGMKHIL